MLSNLKLLVEGVRNAVAVVRVPPPDDVFEWLQRWVAAVRVVAQVLDLNGISGG